MPGAPRDQLVYEEKAARRPGAALSVTPAAQAPVCTGCRLGLNARRCGQQGRPAGQRRRRGRSRPGSDRRTVSQNRRTPSSGRRPTGRCGCRIAPSRSRLRARLSRDADVHLGGRRRSSPGAGSAQDGEPGSSDDDGLRAPLGGSPRAGEARQRSRVAVERRPSAVARARGAGAKSGSQDILEGKHLR